MCGLVGAAGSLWAPDRKAFKQLLYLDAFRGEDSTGMAVVTDDYKVMTDKEIGHPFYLLQNGGKNHSFLGDDGIIKNQVRAVIGHNRYATTGKVVAENAHPFTQGAITGAHNGTLEKSYLNKLENGYKFDVDSEAIFYNINKFGTGAIGKIAGAYALTWYDANEKSMFFIRNDKRPLFYTRRKDKDAFFWASEKWMLEVTLSRLTIAYEEIKSFMPDHLYKLVVDHKNMADFREAELEDLGVFKGFPIPPAYTTTKSGYTATNGGGTPWYSTGKGKVLNFDEKTTDSGWTLDALKLLINSPLDFTISGKGTGISGVEYLRAASCIKSDTFEIRIFANAELWAKLVHSTAIWRGTVKKAVKYFKKGKNELYVTLDMRTIQPSTFPPSVKKELKASSPLVDTMLPSINEPLQGFLGRYMDPDTWYRCTSDGCAWCAGDADIINHKSLIWVDHKEFVCEDCASLPDVKSWIKSKGIEIGN